ncbi:MAG TPA: NAD+ synthase [Nitrososphaeraceae archaeon]
MEQISKTIQNFFIYEIQKRRATGVVIGVSGGVDSSVVATLAVKSLSPTSVMGIILPEEGVTPKEDVEDALDLANQLFIPYKVIDISKIKHEMTKELPLDKMAQGNLSARIRMCILYFFASTKKMLVAGTTDKSELKLGYYTKYGDGSADILPIADLYKTQVREMAQYLAIPDRIIKKDSRPGLWIEHTAEGEIGLSFAVADGILKDLENENFDGSKYLDKDVKRIHELMQKNIHKSEMPTICKI